MAVQDVFPAIGSKSDARMAQRDLTIVYWQHFDGSKEALITAISRFVLAAALLNVLATAVAAEVEVEKDVPKARFFERVQAGNQLTPTAGRGCGCWSVGLQVDNR